MLSREGGEIGVAPQVADRRGIGALSVLDGGEVWSHRGVPPLHTHRSTRGYPARVDARTPLRRTLSGLVRWSPSGCVGR